MGFFSRLGALIRGFFGLFIGRLEEKNPDILFEDIKNQLEKARKKAENQIVEVQTNAEMIKIELKTAENKLNSIRARIESATKQGKKEELVELLMQEEEYQSAYEAHKATYESAMAEVAKIREDFKIFESEMNAKLNEIRTLKSQAKLANFKENINAMNSKFASHENQISRINEDLERAREIVNKKTARANAMESLSSDNIDMKLKRLDMNSARDRALARAEAMLGGDKGFEVKEKIDNKASNLES
ncbi:MAG TPA: hypothetical protein GXX49_00745 [Clostridiaceae bacterium]|nr:hypothetical protein [Clostridiaceae bacterium]